jgi:hypothetical protein
MRITLIGSVAFAKRMVEVYRQLEKMGHEPLMLGHMFGIADGTERELIDDIRRDHANAKRKYDFFRKWHELIKSGDAVLVCNFEKNGIRNYIGGNTLMEMGFAHVNDKKVFLLNPVPEGVPYVDEIRGVTDAVLEGDLGKIE